MDKIKNFYMNLSSKKKGKILLITQIIAWFIWAGLSWNEFAHKYNTRVFNYDLFFYSSILLSLPLIIKLLKFNILETPNLSKSVKGICILFFLIGILNIVFSIAFGYFQRNRIKMVDSNFELNELKRSFEKKCPDPVVNGLPTGFPTHPRYYETPKCISELIKSKECMETFLKEVKEKTKIFEETYTYYEAVSWAEAEAGMNLDNCNYSFLHNKFNLPDYERIVWARGSIEGKSDEKNLKNGVLIAGASIGAWILYILIPFLIKKFEMWFNKE